MFRGRLTVSDAARVALTEGLGVPLVTMDGQFARAGAHKAAVSPFAG